MEDADEAYVYNKQLHTPLSDARGDAKIREEICTGRIGLDVRGAPGLRPFVHGPFSNGLSDRID